MPERAFVTGLTGMVGSHLADYILERTDWRIYGLARWRSPFDNIAHLLPLADDSGADGGGDCAFFTATCAITHPWTGPSR